MRRPSLGLATLLLVFSVASLPLASAQTGLAPWGAHLDHAGQASDGPTTVATRTDRPGPVPGEPDTIITRIDVSGNGTAQWHIEYWVRLRDPAGVERFRRFQRNLSAGTAGAGDSFADRTRQSIAAAETATGREMSMRGFDTNATVRQIPQTYGVAVYRFQWRGFATAEEGRLLVGDGLEGLLLGTGERLLITWPDEYALAEVDPAPDERRDHTAVWRGPTTFGLDGPQLLLVDRPAPLSRYLPVGAAALAAALVVALAWVRRRDDDPAAPLATRAFGDGGEAGDAVGGDEAELLSNEERVIRLLEERGGRIKQQEVVDELGWTTSKTSYVVSTLREQGRIRTFRLGRENVLSLPDTQSARNTNR